MRNFPRVKVGVPDFESPGFEAYCYKTSYVIIRDSKWKLMVRSGHVKAMFKVNKATNDGSREIFFS